MNGYKIVNQNALHFITPTVVSWIDIFSRKECKDIIIESLRYCKEHKGMELFAYVIMSNHIHLMIKAKDGYHLSNILRDFKRHTSKEIIKYLKTSRIESRKKWILNLLRFHGKFNKNNSEYQVWKRDNHPVELRSPKWILIRLNYIHNNPVKAGLVLQAEDYLYSSARNYQDLEHCIIDVDIVHFDSQQGLVYR